MVHGIGQQPYGSTLATGTDAIVRWLQGRFGDNQAEGETDIFNASGALRASKSSQARNRRVLLDSARLQQSELEPGDPAHAYMRFTSGIPAEDEIWLIVESWWADSFARPSYGRMVRWTIRSAIATVSGEVAELYERLIYAAKSRRAWHSIQAMLGLYLYTFILTPALLLVVVLSIAAFIPWIRPLAVRAQAALTGSVGDSYALVRSPATRAAIVSKTKQDLEWLCRHNPSKVLVIAHSQGAEVARQALMESPHLAGRSLRLITYGSGIRKLTLLQKLRSGGQEIPNIRVGVVSSFIALASIAGVVLSILFLARLPIVSDLRDLPLLPKIGVFLAILGLAATPLLFPRAFRDRLRLQENGLEYSAPADAPKASTWLQVRFLLTFSIAILVAVGFCIYDFTQGYSDLNDANPDHLRGAVPFFLVGLLLAVYVGSIVAAAVDQINTFYVGTPNRELLTDFAWWDILASSDPVASAGLKTRSPEEPKTYVIHNLRSILFDHTRYWQNWSEFTPRVLQFMHDLSEWEGRDVLRIPQSWLAHEAAVRARLTTTLVVLRIEAVLLGTLLILEPPEFFKSTERAILQMVQAISIREWPDPSSPSAQHVVGALLVIILSVIPYWGALFFWRASQRRRRASAIDLLRLFDEATEILKKEASQGLPFDFDKTMITRVVARKQEGIVLLTTTHLYLFPLLSHRKITEAVSVALSDITSTRVGLGAVRIILANEHLHVRPIDFMSRRTLRAYIEDAREALQTASSAHAAEPGKPASHDASD